jgi:hypothetical protein
MQRTDFDFEYQGGFNLFIDIQAVVPIPQLIGAFVQHQSSTFTLPVITLRVKLNSLVGKGIFHCLPPPSKRFWIGFQRYSLRIDNEW